MGILKNEVIDNMKNIIDNCMGDSTAACVSACPMNTDVKQYVRLIGEGKGEESISVIREKLFIPGTLGRICAHPCEKNCRRGEEDHAISIAYLKRYAADNFDNPDNWDLTKAETNGKKIAIIGAGPAGAQSALDLVKKGYNVTIFEKLEVVGGMMRVGIPEYRLPRDIIDREYSLLQKLGVEIRLGVEIGKDISFDELKKNHDAVVVAVGRQSGRVDQSLENYDAEAVFHAAEYLKEISLTRDFKGAGKVVAVIGGGDVAMDCARSSKRVPGVERVISIPLESTFDMMPSSNHEINGALEEDVIFKLGNGINRIMRDENGRVSGIELKKCISLFDESGRFSPRFDMDKLEVIAIDTLVFAIGQGVDSSFDKNGDIAKRGNGTFDVDKLTMQSISEKKVFVAGDCTSSFIVVEAMAEGRRAAKSIDLFLNGKNLSEGRTLESEGGYRTKLQLPTEYLPEGWDAAEKVERISNSVISKSERISSFKEVENVFTKSEAEKEANRCLQCECKLCMKECIMLNDYTDCPKTLFTEYLEKGYNEMDAKIAYSCNMCDQCTLKCPKDFDIKSNFAGMRAEYVKENDGKSPMKGHRAIDVHQYLGYSKMFNTTNPAPAGKKTKYVFFPGCSLPSYNPEAVGNVLDHLQKKLNGEVGSLLKCCGKPPKALGQEDLFKERFESVQTELDKVGAETVVVACQSCYGIFKSYAKQDVVSLWELLPEIGLPESQVGIGKESDVVFNIHDSCSIRKMSGIHNGIRWIVDELGYKVEELENSKEKTRCCGFGGMIVPAVPGVAKKVMERRAEETTTGHMITYCAACRESMEKGGADAQHILDLVFGDKYTKAKAEKRNMGPVKQWANRFKSKMELKKRK
ncbi:MAG: FAD-dependent oxidoreductase [Fusobacteriaceae bacterium]